MKTRSLAYNTRRKSATQLEQELVGAERWDILNSILKELSLEKNEPPKQHWLITGPRGIGKSHLLTLLYHKVKNDERLSKQWITVLFPEELRMANDLAKFLERAVTEILLELERDQNPISTELKKEIIKTKEILPAERNEHLFNLLNWIHQTTGRFILLIIENLQQLLGKKISEIEQKKLRAFLQTHDSVLLISSATSVFNILHDHKQPFYHFFHIKRLNDMSFDEMKSLIANLMCNSGRAQVTASISKNEARLRAIHSFTGGNPRMAVFLSEILKTDVPDEMLDFMDELLDELNPYFEAILNDTPDYMEEVMNTLATFEPAQSPKEIADHLEAEQSTIRNYLKQMKDNGYVRVAFSKGNSNFYCLNEYLYRIWYQMRDSSHREETRWIMELLIMLYSPADIINEKNRLASCLPGMIRDSYKDLIYKTADFMDRNPDYCKVIQRCVDLSAKTQIEKNKDKKITDLITIAKEYINTERYKEAIEVYEKIVKINPREEFAFVLWGLSLEEQGYHEEAIKKYEKALEINPNFSRAYGAWGASLRNLERYEDAIEKFSKALKIDPNLAQAYWDWGDCLRSQKRYADAIIKFQKATEIAPVFEAAYGGWGDCLRELKQFDDAEKKYNKAIELDPNYEDAYLNLSICLSEQKRDDEAIKTLQKLLSVNSNSIDGYGMWGAYLGEQKRYEEAIDKFKKVLELDPTSTQALIGWIRALVESEKYDEAILIIENQKEIKDCRIPLYYGTSLLKKGRYEEAIGQFEKLLNIHHNCGKVYMLHGEAMEKLGNKEKAILSYVTHIGLTSTESSIYADFHASYDQYIAPLLSMLNSESYIKHIYSQTDDVKLSMPQVCTLLLLMDRYDIVSEKMQSITAEFMGRDQKERFDSDVMIFSIKLKISLALIEEKMYEALKLSEIFASYVTCLKEIKEKEDAVSKFILNIFKLQARFNVKSEYTLKILESLKKAEVPFNDLFIKIWTCLSDPASIDAQKYLTDKAITELVQQIRSNDTKSDSACKV